MLVWSAVFYVICRVIKNLIKSELKIHPAQKDIRTAQRDIRNLKFQHDARMEIF